MRPDQRQRNSSGAAIDRRLHRGEQLVDAGNGRSAAACSAIHGEYSKTLASAATKSSLLQI